MGDDGKSERGFWGGERYHLIVSQANDSVAPHGINYKRTKVRRKTYAGVVVETVISPVPL